MRIALDFDNTFTLDPNLWYCFIDDVLDRGGSVTIVTVRHPYWDAHPLLDELQKVGIVVIFTDGRAKKDFCAELGLEFDVWIDDRPQTILENSTWKHSSPDLRKWREDNYKKLADEGYTDYVRDLSEYDEVDLW